MTSEQPLKAISDVSPFEAEAAREAEMTALPAPGQTVVAEADHTEEHTIDKAELARIGLVGLAILLCCVPGLEPSSLYALAGAGATLIGAFPIFREAIHNIFARRMTMELSMTIAIVAALAISEFFTALVITFFVLVAEVLEKMTMNRGRTAIRDLLELLPQEAYLRTKDGVIEATRLSIKPNDVVVVKPGSRLPIDGEVVAGHSFIDQSTITGESLPVEKLPGSNVYAGTMNQSGTIDVRATRVGADTAFGKIIHAVEEAERLQAPVQKIADRLSGYLVYFALLCAGLTYLVTGNVRSMISVVIVAGACGIAAGTPLAILGAVGRAARAGAIIKGGLYLELLSKVKTVVFDKTGTLTHGTPAVTGVDLSDGVAEAELLVSAAACELPSEHPLGKAIIKRAQELSLRIPHAEKFEYLPGKGITCRAEEHDVAVGSRGFLQEQGVVLGDDMVARPDVSEVFVARDGRLLGRILICDPVRLEAAEAIAELAQLGIHTVLLTGDAGPIANAIAQKLHIKEIVSGAMPHEKQEFIERLVKMGTTVAMVGDGINDAPALMAASVGVAIGSGTDVARESADVVLIGSDLRKFATTIKIARRCHRIIMANFIGTLLVDGFGVALAACGFLNPLLAAFIHVTSELLFIMNSARLLPAAENRTLIKHKDGV